MKTLFIVHVEDMFLNSQHGFDDNFAYELAEYARKFDYVVHMSSFLDSIKPHVAQLDYVVDEVIDWAWGYEPDMWNNDDTEQDWVIASSGHEWTWVPPELRNGRKWGSITVCGGSDYECLQDFRCVLIHLDIDYQNGSYIY
jgi:hypothetical protein